MKDQQKDYTKGGVLLFLFFFLGGGDGADFIALRMHDAYRHVFNNYIYIYIYMYIVWGRCSSNLRCFHDAKRFESRACDFFG